MMSKFEINPFDRSALSDFRLLAGRTNELRKVRFILRSSAKQKNRFKNILITGNRGVGKTSFLNIIEDECASNNIIPIRLNLTESNSCNANEFFWYLFNQAFNKLLDLNLFGGRRGMVENAVLTTLHFKGEIDPVNWVFNSPIQRRNHLEMQNGKFELDTLLQDLKLMRQEALKWDGGKVAERTKLVFLIDESQCIYRATDILEEIRYMVQQPDLGLGFVFAGDDTYMSSEWEVVFGGTHRDFEPIQLSYFSTIEDVQSYFSKSLISIGWTNEEIEEKLFYRFRTACRNIFDLTSGRPAWINTIASKMFERCMTRESNVLKFDRQAQEDIKGMLESGGQLDKTKIDYVESLPKRERQWLSAIFSCELSSFNQIYFFTKYRIVGDLFMDYDEYSLFCDELIKKGIVFLLNDDGNGHVRIGYNVLREDQYMDTPIVAFGVNTDTMKQWLQISSDGKFSFHRVLPQMNFFQSINVILQSADKCSTVISYQKLTNPDLDAMSFSNVSRQIDNETFAVAEHSYGQVELLYKLIKKMESSTNRQTLHGVLTDNESGTRWVWNAYNYDDKDRIVGFRENRAAFERIESNVSVLNNSSLNFTLRLSVESMHQTTLGKFQRHIINSGDRKKFGIIVDDKMDDLMRFYIRDSNLDKSYETAVFMYDLFNEGYELSVHQLNNTGYVFLVKGELSRAEELFNEVLRILRLDMLEPEECDSAIVSMYNLGILQFLNGDHRIAATTFNELVSYAQRKDKDEVKAAALQVLEVDGPNLSVREVKEGKVYGDVISCISYAKSNAALILDNLGQ